MRGILLCLLCSSAWAQVDPDTQAAKRHFDRGRSLYEEGRYDDALAEFQTARTLKPLPELLYNIARTEERREAWSAAADAYQKYLQEKPDASDGAELKSRIAILRARAPQAPPPIATAAPPPARPWTPARKAAVGVLVSALVLAGVGGILVGTVGPDFQNLQRTCTLRQCAPSDWAGPEARADAGYALFALAGAAAIADIALWVVSERRPALRARLSPLGVGGVF